MPKKSDPHKLRFYFEPQDVPFGILENYTSWQKVCVPVPVPLIPYLTPIMRIWQSRGCLRGTTAEIDMFIYLWSDLIATVNTAGACEDDFMLRQNPLNNCQLQQSIDGGVTWTLAFDYSLCKNPATKYIFETTIQNTFNQWNTATTNTEINNYAPTGTFTSSPDETIDRIHARMQALCQACKIYVYAYCEMIKEINQDATSMADIPLLALAALSALALAVEFVTLGASTPLFIAAGAALGLLGTAAYSALTEAILDDTEAKDQVACLMYATLKDLAPTKENFAIAVNSTTLTGNAELIRSTLAQDISNPVGLDNQFNAFINLLGDLLRPAELGLIEDCLCDAIIVLALPDPTHEPPGQDSGIDLIAGHSYIIMAEGGWTGGFAGFDANGWVGHYQSDLIIPTQSVFSLIGRIGASGAWFFVGTELTFTASASGRLYFAMNDAINAFYDNAGFLTVTIIEA